jgi:hypothetical protein
MERFAAGEITREQYLAMRRELLELKLASHVETEAERAVQSSGEEFFAAVFSHLVSRRGSESAGVLADLVKGLCLDDSAFRLSALDRLDAPSRELAEALLRAKLAGTYSTEQWASARELVREFETPSAPEVEADSTTPSETHEAEGARTPGGASRLDPGLLSLIEETQALLEAAKAEASAEASASEIADTAAAAPEPVARKRVAWLMALAVFILLAATLWQRLGFEAKRAAQTDPPAAAPAPRHSAPEPPEAHPSNRLAAQAPADSPAPPKIFEAPSRPALENPPTVTPEPAIPAFADGSTEALQQEEPLAAATVEGLQEQTVSKQPDAVIKTAGLAATGNREQPVQAKLKDQAGKAAKAVEPKVSKPQDLLAPPATSLATKALAPAVKPTPRPPNLQPAVAISLEAPPSPPAAESRVETQPSTLAREQPAQASAAPGRELSAKVEARAPSERESSHLNRAGQNPAAALKPEQSVRSAPRGTIVKGPGEDWLGGLEELNLGIEQFAAGNYSDAVTNLKKALDAGLNLKRDRLRAQKHLALAHCAQGQESLCRQAFSKLLKLDPEHELDTKDLGNRSAEAIFRSLKANLARN